MAILLGVLWITDLRLQTDYFKAIQNRDASAVEKSLKWHPWWVNARDSMSALQLALLYDCDDCVRILIEKGANLEENIEGQTPIMKAIFSFVTANGDANQTKRHRNLILYLIAQGANLNAQVQTHRYSDGLQAETDLERLGNTALHQLIFGESLYNIQHIAPTEDMGFVVLDEEFLAQDPTRLKKLQANLEIIEQFLAKDAQTHLTNQRGNTPLHAAVMVNNSEYIQILLKHGAATDIKNKNNLTPLELAQKNQARSKSPTEQTHLNTIIKLLKTAVPPEH